MEGENHMKISKCKKESFSIIGKEGSTNDGNDFIQRLWEDANANFREVASLAKKDEEGNILGVWGAMSDFSRSFNPWEEDFSKGLYLAGVEVVDEANPPQGWVKWTIPSYEYIFSQVESEDTFNEVINFLKDNNINLVGAVHEFNCPEDGRVYLFFPIKKL